VKPALSPRAEELLVERALRPLDDREYHELDELGVADDDSIDLAAASVAIAVTPIEQMPAELAAKILAAAPVRPSAPITSASQMRTIAGVGPQAFVPQSQPQPSAPMPPPVETPVKSDIERARLARETKRSRYSVVAPWLAAAACLVAAVGALVWARDHAATKQVATLTPADARADLLAHASDVTTIEWTATADPTAQGAKGDIVWSQSAQKGFMRFAGLAVNDAKQFQYQLWIFDKSRDDAFPVDGGVFDVSSTGEVIIPISAKLAVGDATLFAVTVEKPGGVVVSKRERIVVTAARKS
jgi:anti-sigma-K factor RskA